MMQQFKRGVFLHASAVRVCKKAVLFLGHSTAGKSTISRMLSRTYPIIADDKVFVFQNKSGKWMVKGVLSGSIDGREPALELDQTSFPLLALIKIFKSKNTKLFSQTKMETCKSLIDSVFEVEFQRNVACLETRKQWFSIVAEISRKIKGWLLTFSKCECSIKKIQAIIVGKICKQERH